MVKPFGIDKTIARVRDANFSATLESVVCDEAMPIDVIISPEQEVAAAVLRRLALPGAGQCQFFRRTVRDDWYFHR